MRIAVCSSLYSPPPLPIGTALPASYAVLGDNGAAGDTALTRAGGQQKAIIVLFATIMVL